MDVWHDFLIAMAGASGALVGLLFVAISISLDQLLKAPNLLSRAAGCLELLTGVLMFCCAMLIPDLGTTAMGWIILLGGGGIWLAVTLSSIRGLRLGGPTYRRQSMIAVALFQLATIPQVIAGIAVFRIGDDALYLLAPAFMVAVIVAVLDSWVLMIEVRR